MGIVDRVKQTPQDITLRPERSHSLFLVLSGETVFNHIIQAILNITWGLLEPGAKIFEALFFDPGIVFVKDGESSGHQRGCKKLGQ